METKTFKDFGIGEVVEKTGISQKKLRYWEEQGYIPATERIVCGDRAYRRYSEEHIKKLKEIKKLIDRGYSLEGAVRVAKENIKEGGKSNAN